MLSVIKVFQITTFLVVLQSSSIINAFRIFDVNGVETILALENENVSMLCQTGMPMAYCGFIHPGGKRYSFSGNSLINGHCAVKIRATKNDAGYWKCHIGKHTGIELSKDIELRVVDNLAAIERSITAIHGKEVTLICVTTKDKLPLKYCRFEPPNGNTFSIDSAITAAQPLLNKYYYPRNRSLERGECAVTIHQVTHRDAGVWTCGAAAALGDGHEHVDRILLDVEGLYITSTTGITSGAIGVTAVLAVLAVVVWKKRRLLGTVPKQPEPTEVQELQQRPRTPSPSRLLRSMSPVVRVVPLIVVQSPSEPRSSP